MLYYFWSKRRFELRELSCYIVSIESIEKVFFCYWNEWFGWKLIYEKWRDDILFILVLNKVRMYYFGINLDGKLNKLMKLKII